MEQTLWKGAQVADNLKASVSRSDAGVHRETANFYVNS